MGRVKKILAPVTHPPKIICLGLNYKTHAIEWEVNPPSKPIVFMKPRTTIIGPYDDIVSPSIAKKLDYEVELAVVIGKKCKRVSEDKASDFILGYMVLNDVTARDLQRREKQWFMGKGLDTFAPTGPWIITKDELNVDNLRLTTRVNGELRQDGSTRDMIFKVDYLVSWLSKGITLEPGDIISTGTPSGVGAYMNPPSFLEEGDIVEVNIEGIGGLRNRVKFEKV
ncbi:MAG: fumarylacetoacetate hydrolase family protein [Candidatus Methylarchaceae archaeon HK02M1]|nr:fumarylacetoacetate hydrolase family protein [Candidatus Methylarchaceae archaeon HK01M]MCP8311347.1 fumarylacetoacetate hydrolase family protein [Candidatus Methylarchaceae archaeon HK02M1]